MVKSHITAETFRNWATVLYCFRFVSDNASFWTTREGTAHGLELILYVDQGNYLAAHSVSAGFRVSFSLACLVFSKERYLVDQVMRC